MIGGSIEHNYAAETIALLIGCVPIVGVFMLLIADRAQHIRMRGSH